MNQSSVIGARDRAIHVAVDPSDQDGFVAVAVGSSPLRESARPAAR
jgi:hypothetical protein